MTPQALRNLVREVVWPMLHRLRTDLVELWTPAVESAEQGELPPAQLATTHRQLLQHRIVFPSVPGYVGESGITGAALDESHALYRAVGGERVTRFTISRRPHESVTALSVRLEVTDHNFTTVYATTANCVVNVPDTLAFITPNVVLQPGQILVLRFNSGVIPIDTTTEVSWSDS